MTGNILICVDRKHIGEHVKVYKRIIRRNKTDGFGNSKRVIQKQRGISG